MKSRPVKKTARLPPDRQAATPCPAMFSKLIHLYSVVDQTVAQIRSSFATEVRCQPGCADCCHALFDVSAIEAAYLLELLSPELIEAMQGPARQARQQFSAIIQAGENPATARIRCPLLGPQDTCLCYGGRPINCRTYGTPTVIEGQAHVCGLSGFDRGRAYPTINLAPLQHSLYQYSLELFGPETANHRFPLAQVLLEPQHFLP